MIKKDQVVIVSCTGESFHFDSRILRFADGLELYDSSQPIVFSQTITSDFLSTLKAFYQLNDFQKDKLQVKKQNLQSSVESVLSEHSPQTWMALGPFYNKNKNNLSEIIGLLNCAEMFRVSEYKEVILAMLACMLSLPSGESTYDIEQFIEKHGLKKDIAQNLKDALNGPTKAIYHRINDEISEKYKKQLDDIFNPRAPGAGGPATALPGGAFGGGFGFGAHPVAAAPVFGGLGNPF